jgi:uncharacterized membrane protein YdbT with pleckstrin-like domain
MLSWEERERLADIEENLAAEDPTFAVRMRAPRSARRVPPLVVTIAALLVATPCLVAMPLLPMMISVVLIIGTVEATYRWRTR